MTGAAQGIGQAIALRCIQEGYTVLACDRNKTVLATLSQRLSQVLDADLVAQRLQCYHLDVGHIEEVTAFFETVKAEKHSLYGLVNNAGVFLGIRFEEYTPADIEEVLATNVKGVLYFSQHFGIALAKQETSGVIVNIASFGAQMGSSDVVYGASKAAVLGITKACAMALAPRIRVNAVAPGKVETTLLKNIPPERIAMVKKRELLPESILPEDIAESVWFLLSQQSRHTTGTVLDVNNGIYLR